MHARDGECRLVESVRIFPNKTTLAFSDSRHHLSPFGYNAGETTNMSDREETKRSASSVGTPLGLNRLEISYPPSQE